MRLIQGCDTNRLSLNSFCGVFCIDGTSWTLLMTFWVLKPHRAVGEKEIILIGWSAQRISSCEEKTFVLFWHNFIYSIFVRSCIRRCERELVSVFAITWIVILNLHALKLKAWLESLNWQGIKSRANYKLSWWCCSVLIRPVTTVQSIFHANPGPWGSPYYQALLLVDAMLYIKP